MPFKFKLLIWDGGRIIISIQLWQTVTRLRQGTKKETTIIWCFARQAVTYYPATQLKILGILVQ